MSPTTAEALQALALIGRLAAAPQDEPAPQPSLREELQQRCSDWGVYWRASDAHGVNLSHEQAVELLQDALGVEVEIAPQPLPDAAPSEAGERFSDTVAIAFGHRSAPSTHPLPDAPAEAQAGERYAFVLAQCHEAQDIAASRGWALNAIATASTTDPKARKIATEALLGAQPVREAEPAPKREPLTEAIIKKLAADHFGQHIVQHPRIVHFGRAIERAATGEKGA